MKNDTETETARIDRRADRYIESNPIVAATDEQNRVFLQSR
jgi:hypothetical protein